MYVLTLPTHTFLMQSVPAHTHAKVLEFMYQEPMTTVDWQIITVVSDSELSWAQLLEQLQPLLITNPLRQKIIWIFVSDIQLKKLLDCAH